MDVVQLISDHAWIGWIVLIALFLVIEMLTLDFTFLMLSFGGAAGLVTSLLNGPIWVQVIVAALIAAALVVFLRPPILRRLHRGEDTTPSNLDALIDMPGTVTRSISAAAGEVKLRNGELWTARTSSGEVPAGSAVRVVAIDGATAIVQTDAAGGAAAASSPL